jgi:hypothetical protein
LILQLGKVDLLGPVAQVQRQVVKAAMAWSKALIDGAEVEAAMLDQAEHPVVVVAVVAQLCCQLSKLEPTQEPLLLLLPEEAVVAVVETLEHQLVVQARLTQDQYFPAMLE